MDKGAMPAIALLLGKASAKSSKIDDKDEDAAREYFDEFASALDDDDNDAAYEALKGFIAACKDD